jgi:uncharacterized protein (DUF952 family)
MGIIYHIISQADWQHALDQGVYRPESFEKEGFIHFSKFEQVSATASRYYAGRRDLLLLEVDEAPFGNTVKYEMAPIGETFPHLYRELTVRDVKRVSPLILGPDGVFSWPVKLD